MAGSTSINGFEAINIGSGESYGVREIMEKIVCLSGAEVEVTFSGSKRKGEIPETRADIRKAETVLGWKPRFSMEEGLGKMVG
ncbi:MAG: hypothetical protein QCI38_00900 [Candidatus Thermoplasmatota archaeon]|nr:hypothetical protein [Candidatus Thermoplasmatota archaeon]